MKYITIIILGFIFSFSSWTLFAEDLGHGHAPEKNSAATQVYNISVTEKGFVPSNLDVKSGEEVTLNITRKVESTCAKKVTVPSEKLEMELPYNKMVTLKFTPNKKGEIVFGCAMDQMLGGVIIVN